MTYRVKFLQLAERVKDEYDYDSLFDAIKVAKETNVGPDRLVITAMSDEKFNNEFLSLLTSGFVYVGRKSPEYPDGEVMLMLLKVDERGIESPVFRGLVLPHPMPMPTEELYRFPLQLINTEKLNEDEHNLNKWMRVFSGDQNPETD